MTDAVEDDLKARLAASHTRGDGKRVYEVWEKIAAGEMSAEATQAWAKLLADWIVSTGKGRTSDDEWVKADRHRAAIAGHRAERLHVGLAVSGFAETDLDNLDDEHLLFKCASGPLKLRAASEQIWRLIEQGKATQGLREEWLDYICKQISEFITKRNNREFEANRAGDSLLGHLSLSGKTREGWTVSKVEILYMSVISKFPSAFYAQKPHKYVSAVLEKLANVGAIDQDDVCNKTLERHLREMMTKRPLPESGG